MVWAVVTLPVWISLDIEYQKAQLGGAGREFLLHSWKRSGGGGLVGRPLPTKRESRAYGLHQVSTSSCLYQGTNIVPCGSGHPHPLVYTRLSTVLRLYQVISNFLVYTRSSTIPCLYQGRSELFTPVAAVWWALLRPVNPRRAVSGPFACVAPGRARSTLLGWFWAASILQPSSLRDVQNSGRPFSTAKGGSFRWGSLYSQLRVRTSGAQ